MMSVQPWLVFFYFLYFFFSVNDITFILPVLDFTHDDALYLFTAQHQERPGRWMTWLIQVLFILKWNLHATKCQVIKKLLVPSTFILHNCKSEHSNLLPSCLPFSIARHCTAAQPDHTRKRYIYKQRPKSLSGINNCRFSVDHR